MARIFTVDDVQRLARELGVEYDEAVSLLRRADGDYRKAVRLHQDQRSVFVEPERIEEGRRPAADRAAEILKNIWSGVRSARLRVSRNGSLLMAIPLIVIMLALIAAPHLTIGTLLVMLFLRCRFEVRAGGAARMVF